MHNMCLCTGRYKDAMKERVREGLHKDVWGLVEMFSGEVQLLSLKSFLLTLLLYRAKFFFAFYHTQRVHICNH